MVAIAFVEKLLSYDERGEYSVTIIGEEPYIAYNRVGLTQYLVHRSVDSLLMNPLSWYTRYSVDRLNFQTNVRATKLDSNLKIVNTTGPDIGYDICVLSTGSEAALPPYISKGRKARTEGVFVYRNIADLDAIIRYAESENIKKAGVVGGGLLGLEAAKAVYDLPAIPSVTILERNETLLSRQLDLQAGRMVASNVTDLGIEVLVKVRVQDIVNKLDIRGKDILVGVKLEDGSIIDFDLLILAVGITPRVDVAEASSIATHPVNGGIIIQDDLSTSNPQVYAIGECVSWRDQTYGLVAPGIEMADVLAFNLSEGPKHKFRKLTNASLDRSTKLKLLGVDVASFGDYFADRKNIAIKSITYHDPFASVYKKYIFTDNGKNLLGGMMVGDTTDYFKLLSIIKAGKPLEIPPSQLILGVPRKEGEEDGTDFDEAALVCSCHNVTKGAIIEAVKNGCTSFGDMKSRTKCGTGCGGCVPLATSIFNAEMKKAGHAVLNHLCPHFAFSRIDLFNIIRIKKLRTLNEVMQACGRLPNALGCEVCKPALASIFASLYNELIVEPIHHQNQDTNDRYLANIQRDGTYSVIPRIAGGEITPAKLRKIGEVAEEYGLYTKITGGQRIDMFGAQKKDLPDIWEKLINAGFETGSAYGKALRTVKSCVGTTWCRFGIGDSVAFAIELENRYKGIRAPHKIKGGVSGCVRECAEAQGKDFGLIATDKGWNVFVGGNGGAKPRHATLLVSDVPKVKAIRYVDRFIMFYIRTADKLTRTARWIEQLDGGIEYLHKVIVKDELGICQQLDEDIDALVGSYFDEWAAVVRDPVRRQRFRQFANSSETQRSVAKVQERGQSRPQYWPKEFGPLVLSRSDIDAPQTEWIWRKICRVTDLRPIPSRTSVVSASVKYGNTQLAIFDVPGRGLFASQNMCPHKRAFVLSDGIVGDNENGEVYVSCPLHKRNFCLGMGENAGKCASDSDYRVITFEAMSKEGDVYLKLPEPEALDSVLATSKFELGLSPGKESEGSDNIMNRPVQRQKGSALDW